MSGLTLHGLFNCLSVDQVLVSLAWATSTGRIDPDSDAVKQILEQLMKSEPGETRLCNQCQIPSAQARFADYLANPYKWQDSVKGLLVNAPDRKF